MRRKLACLPIFLIWLLGCATTGGELSPTGKVALQEVTAIAVRRAVVDSPRAAEKVHNIREVATRLQSVTAVASVTDLRVMVDAEIARLDLSPVDQADANSLLNIFEALLREQIGKDEIDSDALVRVNEFVSMVVAALPPV